MEMEGDRRACVAVWRHLASAFYSFVRQTSQIHFDLVYDDG